MDRLKRMDDATAKFYQRSVDVLRITGVSESGLGRIIANDPSLFHDIRGYRNLRTRTAEKYTRALEDFMTWWFEGFEDVLPDQAEGEDLRKLTK